MSLISTYQGRKSLFAEKLISKGVSASGTDGLTTLINKIDDIQHFNSGLTLYADKSIAQSSDTVNLYALLLNEGKPVSGKQVIFEGIASPISVGGSSISINTDYMIVLNAAQLSSLSLTSGSSQVIFLYVNNTWNINIGSTDSTPIGEGIVFIENYAVKYYDSDNVLQTVPNFSAYAMTGGTSAHTAYPMSMVGTTGSNGVASKSYTCTGAGLKTITAKSGSLQSETYSIMDTIFYDTGITGRDTTNWIKTNNSLNVVTTDTETTIKDYTANYKKTIDLTDDFIVTWEMWNHGNCRVGVVAKSNVSLGAYIFLGHNTSWRYFQFQRVNGVYSAKYSADNTNWINLNFDTNPTSENEVYWTFNNLVADRTITYRNLKVHHL